MTAPRNLLALALAAALLSVAPPAAAQKKPSNTLLEEPKVPPAPAGPPRTFAPICQEPRRRPVSLVVGFDRYRDYRPAQLFEAVEAEKLLSTLCPGDRVTLVAVDKEPQPIGETLTLAEPAHIDELVARVRQRKEPNAFTRANFALTNAALAEWSHPELRDRDDLLRVLVFFTQHIESRKSASKEAPDFSWMDPPYWLHHLAVSAVVRPIASATEVRGWEVFLVSTPTWVEEGALGQGLRVDLRTWLEPVRLRPAPPPPPAPCPEVAPAAPSGPRGPPRSGEGRIRLAEEVWQPWIVAGGLGLLCVLVFLWGLSRGRRPKGSAEVQAEPREITLQVRDRIHDQIVTEQTIRLEGPVRVGPAVTSDVVVPGPHSLEILPGGAGASPRVRSVNTLPVEVQRATGGRVVRATETVPVPLRTGDRIQLGGGHELLVRYS